MVTKIVNVTKKVGGSSFGFFRKLYISILMFLLAIIFINAIAISIEQKDPSAGLEYIGNKFLYPTLTLGNESKQILDNKALVTIPEDTNIIKKNFLIIQTYGSIVSSILLIFLWISFIAWVLKWSPFSNASNNFINYGLGLIFFLGVQMLLLALNDQPIWIPFMCFYYFIQSIPYIIQPFVKIADSITDTANLTDVNFSLSYNVT